MGNFDVLKSYQINIGADTKEFLQELNKLEKEAGKKLKELGLTDGLRADIETLQEEVKEMKKTLTDSVNDINININKINTGKLENEFKDTANGIETQVNKIKGSTEKLGSALKTVTDDARFDALSDSFKSMQTNIENSINSLTESLAKLSESFGKFQADMRSGAIKVNSFDGATAGLENVAKAAEKSAEATKKSTKESEAALKEHVRILEKTVKHLQKSNDTGALGNLLNGLKFDDTHKSDISEAVTALNIFIKEYEKLDKLDKNAASKIINSLSIDGYDQGDLSIEYIKDWLRDLKDIQYALRSIKPGDKEIRLKIDLEDQDDLLNKIDQIIERTQSKLKKPLRIPLGVEPFFDDGLSEKQKEKIKGMTETDGAVKAIALTAELKKDEFVKSVNSQIESITQELKNQGTAVRVNLIAEADQSSIDTAVGKLIASGADKDIDLKSVQNVNATTLLSADGSLATENTLKEIRDILKGFGSNGKLVLDLQKSTFVEDNSNEDEDASVLLGEAGKEFLRLKKIRLNDKTISKSKQADLDMISSLLQRLYVAEEKSYDFNELYKALLVKDDKSALDVLKGSKYFGQSRYKRDKDGNIIDKNLHAQYYRFFENGQYEELYLPINEFQEKITKEFLEARNQIKEAKNNYDKNVNSWLSEKGTAKGDTKWQQDLVAIRRSEFEKITNKLINENKNFVSKEDLALLSVDDSALDDIARSKKEHTWNKVKTQVENSDSLSDIEILKIFDQKQTAYIQEKIRRAEGTNGKLLTEVINDIMSDRYKPSKEDISALKALWKEQYLDKEIEQIRAPYKTVSNKSKKSMVSIKDSLLGFGVEFDTTTIKYANELNESLREQNKYREKAKKQGETLSEQVKERLLSEEKYQELVAKAASVNKYLKDIGIEPNKDGVYEPTRQQKNIGFVINRQQTNMTKEDTKTSTYNRFNAIEEIYKRRVLAAQESISSLEEEKDILEQTIALRQKANLTTEEKSQLEILEARFKKKYNLDESIIDENSINSIIKKQIAALEKDIKRENANIVSAKKSANEERVALRDSIFDKGTYKTFDPAMAQEEIQNILFQNKALNELVKFYKTDVSTEASDKHQAKTHKIGEQDYSLLSYVEKDILDRNKKRLKHLKQQLTYYNQEHGIVDDLYNLNEENAAIVEKNADLQRKNYSIQNHKVSNEITDVLFGGDTYNKKLSEYSVEQLAARKEALKKLEVELLSSTEQTNEEVILKNKAKAIIESIVDVLQAELDEGKKKIEYHQNQIDTIGENKFLTTPESKDEYKKTHENAIKKQEYRNKSISERIQFYSEEGAIGLLSQKVLDAQKEVDSTIIANVNKLEEEKALIEAKIHGFIRNTDDSSLHSLYEDYIKSEKKERAFSLEASKYNPKKTSSGLQRNLKQISSDWNQSIKERNDSYHNLIDYIQEYIRTNDDVQTKEIKDILIPFFNEKSKIQNKIDLKNKAIFEKKDGSDYEDFEKKLAKLNSAQSKLSSEKETPFYQRVMNSIIENVKENNDISNITGENGFIQNEIKEIDFLIAKRQEEAKIAVETAEKKRQADEQVRIEAKKAQKELEEREMKEFNASKRIPRKKVNQEFIDLDNERKVNLSSYELEKQNISKELKNAELFASELNDELNQTDKLISEIDKKIGIQNRLDLKEHGFLKERLESDKEYMLLNTQITKLESESVNSIERQQNIVGNINKEINKLKELKKLKLLTIEGQDRLISLENASKKESKILDNSKTLRHLIQQRDNVYNEIVENASNDIWNKLSKDLNEYKSILLEKQAIEKSGNIVPEEKLNALKSVRQNAYKSYLNLKSLNIDPVNDIGMKNTPYEDVLKKILTDVKNDSEQLSKELNEVLKEIVANTNEVLNYNNQEKNILKERNKRISDIALLSKDNLKGKKISDLSSLLQKQFKDDYQEAYNDLYDYVNNNYVDFLKTAEGSNTLLDKYRKFISIGGTEKDWENITARKSSIRTTLGLENINPYAAMMKTLNQKRVQLEKENEKKVLDENVILEDIRQKRKEQLNIISNLNQRQQNLIENSSSIEINANEQLRNELVEKRTRLENDQNEIQNIVYSFKDDISKLDLLINKLKSEIEKSKDGSEKQTKIKQLEEQKQYVLEIQSMMDQIESNTLSDYQKKQIAENDYYLQKLQEVTPELKKQNEHLSERKAYLASLTKGLDDESLEKFTRENTEYKTVQEEVNNLQREFNKNLEIANGYLEHRQTIIRKGTRTGLLFDNIETGRLYEDTRTQEDIENNVVMASPKPLKDINYSSIISTLRKINGLSEGVTKSLNAGNVSDSDTEKKLAELRQQSEYYADQEKETVKETVAEVLKIKEAKAGELYTAKEVLDVTKGMTEEEKAATKEIYKHNHALELQNKWRKKQEKGKKLHPYAQQHLLDEKGYQELVAKVQQAQAKAKSIGLELDEKGYVKGLSEKYISQREGKTVVSGIVDVNKIVSPGGLATESTLVKIHNLLAEKLGKAVLQSKSSKSSKFKENNTKSFKSIKKQTSNKNISAAVNTPKAKKVKHEPKDWTNPETYRGYKDLMNEVEKDYVNRFAELRKTLLNKDGSVNKAVEAEMIQIANEAAEKTRIRLNGTNIQGTNVPLSLAVYKEYAKNNNSSKSIAESTVASNKLTASINNMGNEVEDTSSDIVKLSGNFNTIGEKLLAIDKLPDSNQGQASYKFQLLQQALLEKETIDKELQNKSGLTSLLFDSNGKRKSANDLIKNIDKIKDAYISYKDLVGKQNFEETSIETILNDKRLKSFYTEWNKIKTKIEEPITPIVEPKIDDNIREKIDEYYKITDALSKFNEVNVFNGLDAFSDLVLQRQDIADILNSLYNFNISDVDNIVAPNGAKSKEDIYAYLDSIDKKSDETAQSYKENEKEKQSSTDKTIEQIKKEKDELQALYNEHKRLKKILRENRIIFPPGELDPEIAHPTSTGELSVSEIRQIIDEYDQVNEELEKKFGFEMERKNKWVNSIYAPGTTTVKDTDKYVKNFIGTIVPEVKTPNIEEDSNNTSPSIEQQQRSISSSIQQTTKELDIQKASVEELRNEYMLLNDVVSDGYYLTENEEKYLQGRKNQIRDRLLYLNETLPFDQVLAKENTTGIDGINIYQNQNIPFNNSETAQIINNIDSVIAKCDELKAQDKHAKVTQLRSGMRNIKEVLSDENFDIENITDKQIIKLAEGFYNLENSVESEAKEMASGIKEYISKLLANLNVELIKLNGIDWTGQITANNVIGDKVNEGYLGKAKSITPYIYKKGQLLKSGNVELDNGIEDTFNTTFDLFVHDISQLKNNGLSEEVIAELLFGGLNKSEVVNALKQKLPIEEIVKQVLSIDGLISMTDGSSYIKDHLENEYQEYITKKQSSITNNIPVERNVPKDENFIIKKAFEDAAHASGIFYDKKSLKVSANGLVSFVKITKDAGQEALATRYEIENLYNAINDDGTLDLSKFSGSVSKATEKVNQALNKQIISLKKILELETKLVFVEDELEKKKINYQLDAERANFLNLLYSNKELIDPLEALDIVSNDPRIKNAENQKKLAPQIKLDSFKSELENLVKGNYANKLSNILPALYDSETENRINLARQDLEQLKLILQSIDDETFDLSSIGSVRDLMKKFSDSKSSIFNNMVVGDSKVLKERISGDEAKNLQRTLKTLAIDFSGANIEIDKFTKANREMTYQVRNSDNMLDTYIISIDEFGKATAKLIKSEKYLNVFQKTFNLMGKKLGEILNYTFASVSIYQVINFFRRGITVIQEMDAAMTELRKVSNDTEESLESFRKEAFNIANTVASTGKEIVNSAADWARLGYSIKEAAELAKQTAIYSNVGDMEIDVATEHMISSIKAWESEFANEVETAQAIVDRYNEIGNNYAISSAEIGSAMERSAAALKAGGNTLNESLGLIVAGNTIQQDAETTAAALKILSLRIRGSKAELEEMGESTEGLADSSSKLRQQIKSLSGVDVMLNESTYKSTAQIIKELGAVYNQMTDVSQAALLETIAGKNRASTVEGLLQNYKLIDQVIQSAEKSAGSAAKENLKYAESIQGHLDILTNKWQQMWDSAIKTDVINFFIDLGVSLLDFVSKFGFFKSAFLGFSALFGMKGAFRSQKTTIEYLSDFFNSIKKSNANKSIKGVLSLIGELCNALFITRTGIKGIGDALKSVSFTTWAGIAIAAISAVIIAFNKVKQKQQEALNVTKEHASQFDSDKKSIAEYTKRYEELYEALNEAKGNEEETYNIKNQLLELQYDLNDSYGDELGNINLVTDAYENQIDTIKELNKIKANEYLNENEKVIDEAKTKMRQEKEYTLGSFNSFDNSSFLNDIYSSISSSDSKSIKLEKSVINGIEKQFIVINTAVKNAEEEIHSFMNEIRNLEGKYENGSLEASIIDEILSTSSSAINKNKEITDNYGEIYRQVLYSGIAVDDKLNKDYQEALSAVEEYNNTILTSTDVYNDDNVKLARNRLRKIKDSIENNDLWKEYDLIVKELFNNADTIKFDFSQDVKNNDSPLARAANKLSGISEVDFKALYDSYNLEDVIEDEDVESVAKYNIGVIKNWAEEFGYNINEVSQLLIDLGILQKQTFEEDIVPRTPREMINEVNSLVNGFEHLDKIMASIKDDDPFDYTLLDDDTMSEFVNLDSYTSFIETISEYPDDLDKCKDAFNKLVTEWVEGKQTLKGLSDNTAKLTINMLKNQGVANAEEVVYGTLALQKAKVAAETEDLSTITLKEIDNLSTENNIVESAKDTWYAYFAQKMIDQVYSGEGDVKGLGDVIGALGVGVNAWNLYAEAKERAEKATGYYEYVEGENGVEQRWVSASENAEAWRKTSEYHLEQARKEIQMFIDKETTSNYAGGPNTNGSSGSEPKEEEIDWIERKKEILQRLHDVQEEIANDENASYGDRAAALDYLIEKDKERVDVAKNAVTQYENAYKEASKDLTEEDRKFIEEGGDIIKKYNAQDLVAQGIVSSVEAGEEYIDNLKLSQDCYDKMIESQKEELAHQKESIEHQKQKIQLLKDQIGTQQDLNDALTSHIESQKEMGEIQGKYIGEDHYQKMIEQSKVSEELHKNTLDYLYEELALAADDSEERARILVEIENCKNEIYQCQIEQEELNETIKRLPIERIQMFRDLYSEIIEDMDNYRSIQDKLGLKPSKEELQTYIDLYSDQIDSAIKQQEELKKLLGQYGSEKFKETSAEIQELDNEITSLIGSQIELNYEMLQIPIVEMSEKIEKLGIYKDALNNAIAEDNAKGLQTSVEQYAALHNVTLQQLSALTTQKNALIELLSVYDEESEHYKETQSQIAQIDQEMSSLVQDTHNWNAELLNIPIEQLEKANENLSSYSSILGDALTAYDSALAGINTLIDKEIEGYQEQLDLMEEENEARKVQVSLEQALANLRKAEEQRTTQVK